MKQDLLKKITETGEIFISPSLWSELNEKHSKDDIKHLIECAKDPVPFSAEMDSAIKIFPYY